MNPEIYLMINITCGIVSLLAFFSCLSMFYKHRKQILWTKIDEKSKVNLGDLKGKGYFLGIFEDRTAIKIGNLNKKYYYVFHVNENYKIHIRQYPPLLPCAEVRPHNMALIAYKPI